MVKRRPLTVGLKPSPKADPEKEQAFLNQGKASKSETPKKPPTPKPHTPEQPATPPPAPEAPPKQAAEYSRGRYTLTTRLRPDIGAALKRASLERELAGQAPHNVQDILDVVLEPWLKSHGYLK